MRPPLRLSDGLPLQLLLQRWAMSRHLAFSASLSLYAVFRLSDVLLIQLAHGLHRSLATVFGFQYVFMASAPKAVGLGLIRGRVGQTAAP